MYKAILWDFGGVILTSPFADFAEFERRRGLPAGFLRAVNAANHLDNAWARLERNELSADDFDAAFAAETAALGHEIRGVEFLQLFTGKIQPAMVAALDAVKAAGYRLACVTNNTGAFPQRTDIDEVMRRFDVVVESSKVGVRKPEPRFYEIACELLAVDPPDCVFLDDLGINLKPAREMGMMTIKVGEPAEALKELGQVLGLDFGL
jgi:putative hydrolase of the HAD superfamily